MKEFKLHQQTIRKTMLQQDILLCLVISKTPSTRNELHLLDSLAEEIQ